MLFEMKIGGDGLREVVAYHVNYDIKAIAEGYRKSCEKYGIQFHDAHRDFTGLGLEHWDKRALWTNPDMNAGWFDQRMHDLLARTGVVPEDDMMTFDGREYLANYDSVMEEYSDAIMRFIALSMPKDFTFEQRERSIPCLNDELGIDFGHGLCA